MHKSRSSLLYFECGNCNANAADLLLRWGVEETTVDNNGMMTATQVIPSIGNVSEEKRPTLKALTRLLKRAPQDRAWRRRGYLVLCRAYPDRVRLEG